VRSAKFRRGGEGRVEVSQGKAVMVCKGYFRHGLSWYGGSGKAGYVRLSFGWAVLSRQGGVRSGTEGLGAARRSWWGMIR